MGAGVLSRHDVGFGDEFEPGSGGRVLRNKLGIVDPRRAEEVETILMVELYRKRLGNPEERALYLGAMNRSLLKDYAPLADLIRGFLRERGR